MPAKTSAWWSLSKRTIFASPTAKTARHTVAWWKTYGKCVSVGKYVSNALKEELEDSVVANFATTAVDGKTYQVAYYNLDMIISVGYRMTRDLQLSIDNHCHPIKTLGEVQPLACIHTAIRRRSVVGMRGWSPPRFSPWA